MIVVRPAPKLGPRVSVVRANLWASQGAGDYSLAVDESSAALTEGVVLSTALAKAAKAAGLPSAPLAAARKTEVTALATRYPALQGALDLTNVWPPPRRGPWLQGFALSAASPEPIVLLVPRHPPSGRWTLVQTDTTGAASGGLTLTSG
jgi:hypothetical protein